MMTGALIMESLRVGATLSGIPLTVRRIVRHEPGGTTGDQPKVWTHVDFEVADSDAGALAEALAAALDRPGWYADYHSGTESFVVFPGRVFHYRRGDATARGKAQDFGRGLGIPEHKLDWTV